MKTFLILPLFAALAGASTLAAPPENLLRNGSFEGAMLYWHNVSPKDYEFVRDDVPVGEMALKLHSGFLMSAPFVAQRGEWFTVSLFAKGEGTVSVSMPPSAREVGTKAKRLWSREAGQSAKLTAEWKRHSFSWPADVPPDGFWPNPHYLVQIGGEKGKALFLDGVTVVRGKEGTPAYVPRREIEVVAECVNLPGWDGAKGNMFEKGATAQMVAHVSNPSAQPREVTVRWQLVDYEGERVIGEPVDKRLKIEAGKTVAVSAAMKLVATGTVLARVEVLPEDTKFQQFSKSILVPRLDVSDFPLTSLPYPAAATKPDYRERFGGSFAGGIGVVEKMQRIGFGWARWQPHANGHDHLPTQPADLADAKTWEWKWQDAALDRNETHGISSHLVLYPPPKWIMEKGHPLPKDMRWPANDPRWDDLKTETVWDKFVRAAAGHYAARPVIFEIENEPEFDRWIEQKLGDEYAKFTIRTAKIIRAAAPKAKIMVNNVYGIPSQINGHLFKAGGLAHIDVVSWHDYHAGWLSDANGIKRMRQNMDEAGGKNVEIWFNEGWAFTNTAVDEPIACTALTSAQSTNAIADSTVEMSVTGQKKTVMFHLAYEDHGQSFWDYSGPGQMLWDWYGNPLPLVGMWNVLNHHVGISDEVGFVRPPGANLAIFQDLRNGRGVIVAYADREAKEDVEVVLPGPHEFHAEDCMGNFISHSGAGAAGISGIAWMETGSSTFKLSKSGRPVILYTRAHRIRSGAILPVATGKELFAALEKLDRKNASFASTGAGAAPSWSLPPVWEGKAKGESEGSVAMADGKPVWKLEQLWPADWKQPGNFRPMIWNGTEWNVKEGGFGGQPGATLKDGSLSFGTRASHGPGNDRHIRTAGVTFIAPRAGSYALSGKASTKMWDGKNKTTLLLLKKNAAVVEKVGAIEIAAGTDASLDGRTVALAAGEEFVLLPVIDGSFAGGNCKLSDLRISLGSAPAASAGFTLPAAWEGRAKGSPDGNPISANGKPIWRLDRLFPADPILPANYSPLVWGGTEWIAPDHSQGGHPSARVEDGKVSFGALGPWVTNEFNFPKIPVLVFIAPSSGVYKISGTAKSKPWEGTAKTIPLSLRKRDTQRAAELKAFQLPRDGSPVTIEAEVELTAGHELLFVPMMHGLDNNASNITIENLKVEPK